MMMKTLMMLVIVATGLSGCNTVKGLGMDISGGAETVQGWFR